MASLLQHLSTRRGSVAFVWGYVLVSVIVCLCLWETPFQVSPVLLGSMLALMAASVGISCWKGKQAWLEAGTLWRLQGLALLYCATCDLFFFAYPLTLFLPLLVTMGTLCLLWALFKRWSLVFWCPLFVIGMAQIAGFLQYGARLNSLVIAETLEASAEEAAAYLSIGNLLLLAIIIGIACVYARLMVKTLKNERRLPLVNTALVVGSFALLLGIVSPPQRKENDAWWPVMEVFHLVQSYNEAVEHNFATVNQVENLVPPSASPSSINTLHGGEGVVLIVHIGESVRADRMSINGYMRDTTPWLRQQKNLVNFPDCISVAGDTCQAQIAILTDARRDVHETDENLKPHTGSVLSLFQANGFKVYSFFGRRIGQKLKYDRVIRVLTKCSEKSYNAPGGPWTAVPQMAEVLRANNAGQNLVFFINNEGSHTPFDHYDHKNPPFSPVGSRFENPALHAQEINNAYDSTVHYTDEFVRRVAQLLQGRPFVYLYVSDHGEYLGHDGIWGRAGLGESQLRYHDTEGCRVGMFLLISPQFEKLHPHFAAAMENLRAHTSLTVGHEHIFHTLLGLFGINTPFYHAELDLASPSARPYEGDRPAGEAHPDTLSY